MKKKFFFGMILLVAFCAKPVLADARDRDDIHIKDNAYINVKYAYSFKLPEGFSMPVEADNGDGIVMQSNDEKAVVRVYAGRIVDVNFVEDNKQRLMWDKKADWKISYEKITLQLAVWSGQKGHKILYNYSIPHCGKAMLTLNIRYDQSLKSFYDKKIPEWLSTLKPLKCQNF